ncbi:hypothetical protein [Halorhabdus amylolytica]|uniref:hypothetical protein n=1 Tax=Halorhabdus amylolytica TaxID=2559573 RepID=UPI0010AA6554|nr:hypothetical protein [Halorhabdus amylolytica]
MTERTGLLNIQLSSPEDQEVWQQAEQAVAQTLGTDSDDLSRSDVARELAEAYTGQNPLGAWQE